ncbi:hypothetical protein MTO96_023315 [Rhipicephalus appendiculatus]
MEHAQKDLILVRQQLHESQSLAAVCSDKQKHLEECLSSAQQEAAAVASAKSSLEQQVKQLVAEIELTRQKRRHAEDEASKLKESLEARNSDIQCVRVELEDIRGQLEKASREKFRTRK